MSRTISTESVAARQRTAFWTDLVCDTYVQLECDPSAGRETFRSFTRIDLAQPSPPEWSYVLLDDHPTVIQRIAMTKAWADWAKSRASGRSQGGS